jgi:hypothetical protein
MPLLSLHVASYSVGVAFSMSMRTLAACAFILFIICVLFVPYSLLCARLSTLSKSSLIYRY